MYIISLKCTYFFLKGKWKYDSNYIPFLSCVSATHLEFCNEKRIYLWQIVLRVLSQNNNPNRIKNQGFLFLEFNRKWNWGIADLTLNNLKNWRIKFEERIDFSCSEFFIISKKGSIIDWWNIDGFLSSNSFLSDKNCGNS